MIHAGERLREEREKKNLSLEEVSRATKIRPSFLTAIEKGDYNKLPSGTYAHGFVRNYAKYLGLRDNELLALFKREYDEEKYLKVLPEGLVRRGDFPIRKIIFNRTFKIIIVIFVALIAYLVFQFRAAIFNPSLDVLSPKENEVVNTLDIMVTGKTDPNSTIYINDEVASLDKKGNFTKTINVFPGTETITIKAVNNFNKTTIVERKIEVK